MSDWLVFRQELMEGLVILLLLVALWLLLAPIIALVKAGKAEREAAEAREQVRDLQKRLRALETELRQAGTETREAPPEMVAMDEVVERVGARDFRSSLSNDLTMIGVSSGTGDVVNRGELVSLAREFLNSVNIEGREGGEWKTLAENEVVFRPLRRAGADASSGSGRDLAGDPGDGG